MPIPRISSRTPLQVQLLSLPVHTQSQPPILSPTLATFMALVHPRKSRHRTTFIALLALVCISAYIFFLHPSLSPSFAFRRTDSPAAGHLAVALEAIRNSRLAAAVGAGNHGKPLSSNANRTKVELDHAQELAAVSSFLASLPQNVIPLSVDPWQPIDPQLVLDFDTESPRAAEEVQAMVDDVWTRNPVFLYSKLYSPVSRELKTILTNMYLRPAPTIIDVDTRDDFEVLPPLLSRLTSTPELPILLIGGKSVGSIEEIRSLHETGELQQMITASGAVLNGTKKPKGKK